MKLIDGKKISSEIKEELKKEIVFLKTKDIVPTLVIVQVGNNQASNVYVRNKIKLSNELGANTSLLHFDEDVTEEHLLQEIKNLNEDDTVNGILVQLPLPKHIDENKIIEHISPIKDVDCFHLENVGKLWTAKNKYDGLLPCTPAGIIELLKRSDIQIAGKNVVILGRSNIVGKPMAALFLLENATPTICHSKTQNIKEVCSKADILIISIGQAKFITKDYVSSHMDVIDVDMDRDENNKLCGGADFENIKDIVNSISPVPGGVGPMTIVMLMKNLITVCKIQNKIS
ncbi:MAG: bifunctional methylenetetrahydrofolate dehydrogenase/methenyltetrahydrofolate cyclohydrolase [Mycoplasmataceae bacterium]|jgi:methylenetetrahydrofolate dehydrogenase (NADP+)/methenyltetrahydrofolate cyclohydrolase|nr:bifunctional methylenetetrahydrofolate dehydrogenase/methenyltetrahydrofolate cyclohydrolase [Mycoplasmataceae bacterium]